MNLQYNEQLELQEIDKLTVTSQVSMHCAATHHLNSKLKIASIPTDCIKEN